MSCITFYLMPYHVHVQGINPSFTSPPTCPWRTPQSSTQILLRSPFTVLCAHPSASVCCDTNCLQLWPSKACSWAPRAATHTSTYPGLQVQESLQVSLLPIPSPPSRNNWLVQGLKAHLQMPSHWGWGLQHINFRGHNSCANKHIKMLSIINH